MDADNDLAEIADIEKKVIAATLTGDADAFASAFAPHCLVNAPNNRVTTAQEAIAFFRSGLISYASYERHNERIARLPSGQVVTMGEEVLVPKDNAPNAGKRVRRRFTDLWGKIDGQWRLELRQATIVGVD